MKDINGVQMGTEGRKQRKRRREGRRGREGGEERIRVPKKEASKKKRTVIKGVKDGGTQMECTPKEKSEQREERREGEKKQQM